MMLVIKIIGLNVDIELARTFLEIARCGSFMAAAERLHITQTTVTARVHNLEGLLGCRLFVRNRSGASLTDNGRHFVSHANQLLQTWEASRRDLPLPEGSGELITLGCEISLWNPLLVNWLTRLAKDAPNLAVRVEVGERAKLHEKLRLGVLNAVLVHQPEYWPGIHVEPLLEEKLIMVSSVTGSDRYVYIDWGETFRRQHDAALPHFARAGLSMDLGPLALRYILENGGKGYFRTRVVQRHLDDGVLVRESGAPEFSYPIYLMHQFPVVVQPLTLVLDALRTVVRDSGEWH